MTSISRMKRRRHRGWHARDGRRSTHLESESGLELLTAVQLERLEWYSARYVPLVQGFLRHTDRPNYLGDRSNRVCRYCSRSRPAVTFKKVAHAFPEQIGNKALLDAWECDACNEHFSKAVEDDFAKWSQPLRSTGRIFGKQGVPRYKSKDKGMRVESPSGKELRIHVGENDLRYEVDSERKMLTLKLERQPYTPMGAYKCLVKMAIAVLPEEEAAKWSAYKRWTLEPTHAGSPFLPLQVIAQMVAGPLPNDSIWYQVFRRVDGVTGCPQLVFAVQFSNAILQIGLVGPEPGSRQAFIELSVMPVPHPWGTLRHEREFGQSIVKVLDLSSTSVVRDDAEVMRFRFEREEEMPILTPAAEAKL